MWAWLATLGLGCGSAYQEVPAWLVASTRTPFPLHLHRTTILDAVDGDPATAWHAEAGEIGTFYAAGNHVDAVRIDGYSEDVEMRTFRPGVAGRPVGDWVQHTIGANGVLSMASSDRAVELRFRQPARVSITLLSRSPGQRTDLDSLQFISQYTGSGYAMDYDAVRFETIDLNRCVVEPPGNMPDGAYVGDIDCTERDLRIDASSPYRGRVTGTFPIEAIGPCLRMVDGWPMAICR